MKKLWAKEMAITLISYGYQVYLSKSGEYGFYTDGQRVVSFEFCLGVSKISGNYISKAPRYSGTGWIIADAVGDITPEQAAEFLATPAPRYATQGHEFRYTTPDEHVKLWGASGYTEALINHLT